MNEYDAIGSESRHGRSMAGGVATVALAAAVGAGVALLFTTDSGARARHRVADRLRDLELGERAGRAGHAARRGFDTVRREGARRVRRYREPERDSSGALYATLGTVAGAALAALLTPQRGRDTRDWIGNTFDDIRQNASLRWKEHRARRKSSAEPQDEAVRRLQENGHEEWEAAKE